VKRIALIGLALTAVLLSGCGLLQGTKLAPVAVIQAVPQQGSVPLQVDFSAASSHNIYGEIVSYQWDFGDGATSEQMIVTHTYERPDNYVVSLTVQNGFGISHTAQATLFVKRRPVPDAPTGLRAEADDAGEVELSWRDDSDNETGFRVERRPDGGDFQTIETLGADAESFADAEGLAPAATYCYRVIAFNEHGDSGPSNTACAEVPEAPSGNRTDTNENDLVLVERTISVGEDAIEVEIRVEAKVALELAAIVESLDGGLTLASGELSAFQANLSPDGDPLVLSYTLEGGEVEGEIAGEVRAKPVDEESRTLELVSPVDTSSDESGSEG